MLARKVLNANYSKIDVIAYVSEAESVRKAIAGIAVDVDVSPMEYQARIGTVSLRIEVKEGDPRTIYDYIVDTLPSSVSVFPSVTIA